MFIRKIIVINKFLKLHSQMDANEYEEADCCCHGELSSIEDSIGEVINSGKLCLASWFNQS